MVLSLIRIRVKSVVKANLQWLAFTCTALSINKIIQKVKGESWKENYYELYPKKLDRLTTIQLLGLRLAVYIPISLLLQHFINSLCYIIKVRFIHALTVCNPCMDCTQSDYSPYPE